MNQEADIKVVELTKDDAYLVELSSKYSTSAYYDLSVCREPVRWRIDLTLKPFEKTTERNYRGKLFEDHVTDPRVFAAVLDGRRVGWIELGYDLGLGLTMRASDQTATCTDNPATLRESHCLGRKG